MKVANYMKSEAPASPRLQIAYHKVLLNSKSDLNIRPPYPVCPISFELTQGTLDSISFSKNLDLK